MDALFLGKKKFIVVIIIFSVLLNVFFLVNSLSGIGELEQKTTSKNSVTPTGVILPSVSPKVLSTQQTQATVTKVIDGDTFEITGGKKVRMIGIDTPETVDPRRPLMCFGKQASDRTKELLLGKTVGLEKDVSETDKYGRLLRYVYVNDTFINKYLVEEGYAHASSYPPDIKYQNIFRQAEAQARESNKGLWADCISGSSTDKQLQTLSPTIARDQTVTTNTGSSDMDCKDFKTHAEAQAYFDSKGGSPTNNVDKLDGSDHDGKVCETLP